MGVIPEYGGGNSGVRWGVISGYCGIPVSHFGVRGVQGVRRVRGVRGVRRYEFRGTLFNNSHTLRFEYPRTPALIPLYPGSNTLVPQI